MNRYPVSEVYETSPDAKTNNNTGEAEQTPCHWNEWLASIFDDDDVAHNKKCYHAVIS